MTVKNLMTLFCQKYYLNNKKLKETTLVHFKKNQINETKKLILNTRKFHSKFKNVYKLNEKKAIEWTSEWFLREKEGDNNYKITKEQITKYDKL